MQKPFAHNYSEKITEVESATLLGKFKIFIALFVLFSSLIFLFLFRYSPDRPSEFDDITEQFKYGSIGSDVERGIPIEVLRVLPKVFPEYWPANGRPDYSAFGFIQERNHTLPIGFSKRRRVVDLTGLNCAACHTGAVRPAQNEAETIVLGMPSNTVDLQSFFDFLFKCAQDERFNADVLIPEIKRNVFLLPIVDDFVYRQAIAEMKAGLLLKKIQLEQVIGAGHPRFGPGRVDTFNPYKVDQFWRQYSGSIPENEKFGTADFPSIWNQSKKVGLSLHWDGNNSSVKERNISAALGAGATPSHVDIDSLNRIASWLGDLPSPALPDWISVDDSKRKRGEIVFQENCATCHSFSGANVGKVQPIELIRTDPGRLNSYTEKLKDLQVKYTSSYPWRFTHFAKTNGYANQPLDGVWARAPYLHNGSVPTVYDLLQSEETRPTKFRTGHGVIDERKLGIKTDVSSGPTNLSFEFDTTLPGNSNQGHSGEAYGTSLSDADKEALIEFLKTI